jgi:hypothetical protein
VLPPWQMLSTLVARTTPGVQAWSDNPPELLQCSVGAVTETPSGG